MALPPAFFNSVRIMVGMEEKTQITNHARHRMKQRKIPDSLIQEAIEKGARAILADRDAIEYRLRNVLGIRNHHLVVITGRSGQVITSYVDNPEKSRQRRQNFDKNRHW